VSICGGEDISLGLIDSVYTIFDVDGDGSLSTEEFISIMKSRLKRGLKVSQYTVSILSVCSRYAVGMQSVCSRYAVSMQSVYCQYAVSMQSVYCL